MKNNSNKKTKKGLDRKQICLLPARGPLVVCSPSEAEARKNSQFVRSRERFSVFLFFGGKKEDDGKTKKPTMRGLEVKERRAANDLLLSVSADAAEVQLRCGCIQRTCCVFEGAVLNLQVAVERRR